jgi:hypothetical protein
MLGIWVASGRRRSQLVTARSVLVEARTGLVSGQNICVQDMFAQRRPIDFITVESFVNLNDYW